MSFTISPAQFQRPYIAAGHAPANAQPGTSPTVPQNTPTRHTGTGTHIGGQPDVSTRHIGAPVDVPTAGTSASLSALAAVPDGVRVTHLDLTTAASPHQVIALTVHTPLSGVPIRDNTSFIAPTGITAVRRPS